MDEQRQDVIPMRCPDDKNGRSPCEDIVDLPRERRHDSGTDASVWGIGIAFIAAVFGGALLGAGYGAFIGLCGKKFLNVGLALTIPFWLNAPAQMGFWWGHLQEPKWRSRISLVGLATCGYAVCVGWLASVLDGPGLVFNPVRLCEYLSDATVHGVWAHGMEAELQALSPWLLTLRFGELFWLFSGGLLSRDAESPFPYCQSCRRWMEDEATVRVRYEPSSNADVRELALQLVAGRYDSLLRMNTAIAAKEKGLELSAHTCAGCDLNVLNATWFRTTPDSEASDVEQMLESSTGRKLVTELLVPPEVRQHIVQLQSVQSVNAKAA